MDPQNIFKGRTRTCKNIPWGLSRVQHFWVQNETWLQRPAQNWPRCQYSAATMSVRQIYRFCDPKEPLWRIKLHLSLHEVNFPHATTDKDTSKPSSSPFWKFHLHSKRWLELWAAFYSLRFGRWTQLVNPFMGQELHSSWSQYRYLLWESSEWVESVQRCYSSVQRCRRSPLEIGHRQHKYIHPGWGSGGVSLTQRNPSN